MKKKQAPAQSSQATEDSVVRYHPDIATGLSEDQVRQRMQSGLGNNAVKPEAKTVGAIIKSNLFTYFNLVFAVLTVLVVAAVRTARTRLALAARTVETAAPASIKVSM